jgi:hypothetical protein
MNSVAPQDHSFLQRSCSCCVCSAGTTFALTVRICPLIPEPQPERRALPYRDSTSARQSAQVRIVGTEQILLSSLICACLWSSVDICVSAWLSPNMPRSWPVLHISKAQRKPRCTQLSTDVATRRAVTFARFLQGGHQGTPPSRFEKLPVGPSSGNNARRMASAAPSGIVWWPR